MWGFSTLRMLLWGLGCKLNFASACRVTRVSSTFRAMLLTFGVVICLVFFIGTCGLFCCRVEEGTRWRKRQRFLMTGRVLRNWFGLIS